MVRLSMLAAGLLLVGLGGGAPASGQSPAITLQQSFNEASRAFEAGDWRRSASLYQALRPSLKPRTTPRALADLREGYARLRLGEREVSVRLMEEGLAILPRDSNLASDRLLAVQALADAYEQDHEVMLAARAYRQQIDLAPDVATKLDAYAGYIRTALFDEPKAAIQAATEMYALAGKDRRHQAVALNLMGRAQLAAGARVEAIQTLLKASSAAGGLTQRIDNLDASIRSDLGLTALLTGDQRLAHMYVAATGTAQDPGAYLPPPTNAGIRMCPSFASPADLVIVEFAVDPSGRAMNVRPIYSSRGGHYAAIMSGYAADFRWAPSRIDRLRPFQASHMRLELRCAKEEVGVAEILRNSSPRIGWFEASGVTYFDEFAATNPSGLQRTEAELVARERAHGATSPQLLPVLDAYWRSPLTGFSDGMGALDRSIRIVTAAKAPPAVVADYVTRRELYEIDDDAEIVRRLQVLAKNPIYAKDPEASAFLNYYLGLAVESPPQGANEYLQRAAATPELPVTHPLRRAASLRLFHLYRGKQNKFARAKHLAATGLVLSPCGLANLTRMSRAAGSTFPKEAARWGLEGWSVAEFDVNRRGQAYNVRPVISYPPLVFSDAVTRAASSLKFKLQDSTAADGGCRGSSTAFTFRLHPNSSAE